MLPVVEVVHTSREHDLVGHLGPDPLRADWNANEAVRLLEKDPARPVAAALLDQRLLAGLGNLWVNELCFLRGLSPWKTWQIRNCFVVSASGMCATPFPFRQGGTASPSILPRHGSVPRHRPGAEWAAAYSIF